MKEYHCPDCGGKQDQEIDWPSRFVTNCPICGSRILVKFDKTGLDVKVINPAAKTEGASAPP
jgi:DNA-directed RNA polymerase subunit RPC12/RpoP